MIGINESQKNQSTAQNAKVPTGIESDKRKKKCSKCGIEKAYSEFQNDRSRLDGKSYVCKVCSCLKSKKYHLENKESVNNNHRIYKLENKEAIRKREKIYHEKNKEKISLRRKNERLKNPEKFSLRSKKFYQDNKEVINLHRLNRYKNDPYHKLEVDLRSRISKIVRKIKNGASPNTSILGCTKEKFIDHIESMFKNGMTWDNHSQEGWHIDHVKPISLFNLTDPAQVKLCFHYSNTQPLWAEDNLKKGDKYHG